MSAASSSMPSSANSPARCRSTISRWKAAPITPHPAIAVNFRSFDTVCGEPVRCTVEVADTVLQQGQGMHGSFSRADTWNFMAMQGPDFKSQFVDPAPTSNADIGRTIAQLMHLDVSRQGQACRARAVRGAARRRGARGVEPRRDVRPGANGLVTVLDMQMVGNDALLRRCGLPRPHRRLVHNRSAKCNDAMIAIPAG